MATNQSKHYDKISEIYQDHYFDNESKYYRSKIYVERFKKYLTNGKDVLDIGCGDGSFIEILIENEILNKNYFGLDVSLKKFFMNIMVLLVILLFCNR